MKIAIDSRVYTKVNSGIPNYAEYLMNLLPQIAKDIDWIFYINRKDIYNSNFNNVSVKIGPYCHTKLRGNTFLNIILPILLKKDNVDIFHAVCYMTPIVKPSCKLITTIHDLSIFYYPKYYSMLHQKKMSYYINLSVKQADRIITLGNSIAKEIVDYFKIDSKKVSVVPDGINDYFFSQKTKDYIEVLRKYNISKPFILCVGTVEPRKNLLYLLQAYKILPENIKKDILLVHAGGNEWGYEDVYKTIDDLKLNENVKFLEYVDIKTLKVLYENALLFIMPSKYEGFGLPIIEAMACGAPVITSDIAPIREITGDNAFLIDPENIESISAGMNKLINDTNLRKILAEKGKIHSTNFTALNMAYKTLNVYRELAENK